MRTQILVRYGMLQARKVITGLQLGDTGGRCFADGQRCEYHSWRHFQLKECLNSSLNFLNVCMSHIATCHSAAHDINNGGRMSAWRCASWSMHHWSGGFGHLGDSAFLAMSPAMVDCYKGVSSTGHDKDLYLIQGSIGIARQVAQLVEGSLLFPHIPV